MSASPLVSLGILSYNNAPYLASTLDSLAGQHYDNLEIIIADDGSRDNTVEVARQWMTANPGVPTLLIDNAVNRGVCSVANQIVTNAKGEYIGVIGSDDLYLPDKVRTQVAALQKAGPEYGVSYSNVELIDSQGRLLPQNYFERYKPALARPGAAPEGDVFHQLLESGNFIAAPSFLVHRRVFDKIGLYDESLAYEDWDIWLRVARSFKFHYEPSITARYRLHGLSSSITRKLLIIESSLQLVTKHFGIDAATDQMVYQKLDAMARELYEAGSPDAAPWLRRALKGPKNWRTGVYLLLAQAGVTYPTISQLTRKTLGREGAGTV